MQVFAVGRSDLPPLKMPDRFATEVVYFTTPPGERGAPSDLGPREYWIREQDARVWLEELVVKLVSPLDASSKAEVGLTEYHEAWLEWLVANGVQRVKLV